MSIPFNPIKNFEANAVCTLQVPKEASTRFVKPDAIKIIIKRGNIIVPFKVQGI